MHANSTVSAHDIAPATPRDGNSAKPHDLPRMMLHVAWMSIGLGILLQILTNVVAKLAGASIPELGVWLRDASQKVSWSTMVCLGVALGTAASKARVAWSGAAGLLAAPAAFVSAKAVQKAVGSAVGASAAASSSLVFWSVLALKGGQYAVFGAVIAWVASRRWGGLWAHVGIGAASGATFGMAAWAVAVFAAEKRPATPQMLGQAASELVFPVGCALVLYFAGRLSGLMKQS